MVNAFRNNSIKTRVRVLVLTVVLATIAIIFFQLKWLESGYQTSRDQVRVEGDRILNEVFIEQKKLFADTIKILLKKIVKSENDFIYRLDHYGKNRKNILYNNSLHKSESYASFELTAEEFSSAKKDPYRLFWKKINEADFDKLHGICSRLLLSSDVNSPEGSEKEKIELKIADYYDNSKVDTKTLYRLIRRKTNKIDPKLKFSLAFVKEISTKHRDILSVVEPTGGEMVREESIGRSRNVKFSDKLDSIHIFIKRLNEKGKSIYVAKPIFDFTVYDVFGDIPTLILIIDVPKSYLFGKMLTSIISSFILLLLIGTSLTYMIYLIIKQKKLSDLKNDFINNMSHELKTPVATALAAVQGMQYFDVLKDESKTQNYLNTAATELKRLSAMISSILNSAVFENGNFNLNREKFNLKDMLMEMSANLSQQAKKEVFIHIDETTNEEIIGDKGHLHNVFVNLIDNAIKYSGEKVDIKISAQKSENELKINIQDNGNGILLTHQHQIFDQFFRVPNGNDHRVKGHGLGLNYVRSIVEKHGGKILLAQSSPAGSTFEINLPQ